MFVVFCVYVREGARNRAKDREMEGWLLFNFLISKSEIGSVVKNLPASAEDTGSIPGSGRFPEEGSDNPLQYFAWKIPWTEEPVGLQSIGLQRVGHNWADSTCSKAF